MMRTIKYYLLAFLLGLSCACHKSGVKNVNPPGGDGTPSGSDQGDSPAWAVKPINDNPFPEAVFTDPRLIAAGKASGTIINRLTSLVNAAPQGSSIYMSVFLFHINVPGLITAIAHADQRGVHLHIEIDREGTSASNHDIDAANEKTVKKLLVIDKDMDVVNIHNSITTSSINHNKFALFSELSTLSASVENVVFTSSENWTIGTEKLIQNAVTLSDEGLYEAYLRYWKEMKLHADHDMKNYTFVKYDDLQNGIQAFFYPKIKNGSYFGPDPIVDILDQIRDPAADTIQFEMPFWSTGRPDIIHKLESLLRQGAKIEIVVRSNQSIHDDLVKLAKEGAYVKMYNYSNVPGIKKIGEHSKVMLIRGKWNGHKTNVIVTGSENYTYGPLHTNNNNNLLLSSYYFKHPEIFQAFEDNFNAIKILPGVCCMADH